MLGVKLLRYCPARSDKTGNFSKRANAMNKPMDWEQLLNRERFYWPRDLEETKRPKDDDILDVFQVDCSRITLSPPFHRLQRKTQVLPFPRTDYPRTRLTHTNEVSDCGRQIARLVGMKLANEGIIRNEEINSIEDIVAAACKAHDIGNPPFGHAGEFAIPPLFMDGAEKGLA
jgi:dGTPase